MSHNFHVSVAVRALRAGSVIAYPTEAVWGLGCDPANTAALEKLLWLKRRSAAEGLILVGADIAQFSGVLSALSPACYQQLAASWPGPVTWLVPHAGKVHPLVHGRFNTVALRVSHHPLVRELCRGFDGPLVSTSANPRGRQPAMDAAGVRRYFDGGVNYVLAGALGGATKPSEIRDLVSGRIIRQG